VDLVEKTNNATDTIGVDSTVKYTLGVTNTGNQTLSGLEVIDALPGGFTYVAGSTTGATTFDPTISDGKLTWNILGIMNPGDTVVIEYEATVESEVADGTYTNLATCRIIVGEVYGDDFFEGIRTFILQDEYDGEFDEIECNVASSKVIIGSGLDFSASVEGQVLGAATELPAAGNETNLLFGFLALMGLGVGLKIAGRKYEN